MPPRLNPAASPDDGTDNQANLINALGTLVRQLADGQTDMLRAIQNAATNNQPPAPTTNTTKNTMIKIPDPTTFNGGRDDVKTFRREVEDSITINEHAFDTTLKKVLFTARHFGPVPSYWYRGLKDTKSTILDDFDTFLDALEKHFGDPDIAATSRRKLQALTQKASAADYASKFMEICIHLDMTEESKIHAFKKGLNSQIRLGLIHHPETAKSFDKLVAVCISLDNELFEFERSFGPPPGATTSTTATVKDKKDVKSENPKGNLASRISDPKPALAERISGGNTDSTSSDPGPSTSRKLTPEQRAERMKNGECLYCGKTGHKVAECPAVAGKVKAQT